MQPYCSVDYISSLSYCGQHAIPKAWQCISVLPALLDICTHLALLLGSLILFGIVLVTGAVPAAASFAALHSFASTVRLTCGMTACLTD